MLVVPLPEPHAGADPDQWRAVGMRASLSGGFDFTLGYAIEALWYDAYLHADDIRAALGQPSVRSDAGLRVSLSHIADTLTSQGHGDATLALAGQAPFDVGNGGKAIRGDALEFVKAATRRGDPAAFGCDETINIYR